MKSTNNNIYNKSFKKCTKVCQDCYYTDFFYNYLGGANDLYVILKDIVPGREAVHENWDIFAPRLAVSILMAKPQNKYEGERKKKSGRVHV